MSQSMIRLWSTGPPTWSRPMLRRRLAPWLPQASSDSPQASRLLHRTVRAAPGAGAVGTAAGTAARRSWSTTAAPTLLIQLGTAVTTTVAITGVTATTMPTPTPRVITLTTARQTLTPTTVTTARPTASTRALTTPRPRAIVRTVTTLQAESRRTVPPLTIPRRTRPRPLPVTAIPTAPVPRATPRTPALLTTPRPTRRPLRTPGRRAAALRTRMRTAA